MFGIEEATAFGHSGVSSVTNKKLMEKAFRENKYMQEYAFDRNKEMWDLSNQYNLPINQMERLRQAGISPHLAYAKGTINNVGSSQLPKYQAATQNYHATKFGGSYGSSVSDYVDLRRKNAEADIAGSVAAQQKIKAEIAASTKEDKVMQEYYKWQKMYTETDNNSVKKQALLHMNNLKDLDERMRTIHYSWLKNAITPQDPYYVRYAGSKGKGNNKNQALGAALLGNMLKGLTLGRIGRAAQAGKAGKTVVAKTIK